MAAAPDLPFVENEIAMRGDGNYNRNSALQLAAVLPAMKLFPDLSNKNELTLVDYGCSQGGNSITPIKQLLSTLPNNAAAHIVFNDRPYNDFSTLAATIKQYEKEISRNDSLIIYPSMVPISFYKQVVSPASVDVGVSWSSFNYLEHRLQLPLASNLVAMTKQRAACHAQQAHGDLVKLLKLRAAEIKTGGCFIAALGGRAAGATSRASADGGSLNAITQAMMVAIHAMIKSGRLTQQQVIAMNPPMHERSMEECDAALVEVAELWTVERQFEQMVVHPAYAELQEKKATAKGDEAKIMESSREYASIVIEWMMAAFSWFFVKALRVGVEEVEKVKPWTSEEVDLLEHFTAKTKEAFLESFRDTKVEFCYLYLKLLRR